MKLAKRDTQIAEFEDYLEENGYKELSEALSSEALSKKPKKKTKRIKSLKKIFLGIKGIFQFLSSIIKLLIEIKGSAKKEFCFIALFFFAMVLCFFINLAQISVTDFVAQTGETIVSSVSQKLTPPSPTPTPSPTTAPAVAISLPSPAALQKCPLIVKLGNYWVNIPSCEGEDGEKFKGVEVVFEGENNYELRDKEVLVDTTPSGRNLTFSVQKSSQIFENGVEIGNEVTILADNGQDTAVCSPNYYYIPGADPESAECEKFPIADYISNLGKGVIYRMQSQTFVVFIPTGQALEIDAKSVDTDLYNANISRKDQLVKEGKLVKLPLTGRRAE